MIYWGTTPTSTASAPGTSLGAALVAAAGLVACVDRHRPSRQDDDRALTLGSWVSNRLVPTFWSLPSAMLTGVAAAGGLAHDQCGGQPGRVAWSVCTA